MKTITIYRTVGFTESTLPDGAPEVGYKGEFFRTREEAAEAGCGVTETWHHGEETREYRIEDRGDRWHVYVDGEFGSDHIHDEVVEAATSMGLIDESDVLQVS